VTAPTTPRRRISTGRVVRWALIASSIVVAVLITAEVATRFIEVQARGESNLSSAGRSLVGEEKFDGPAGALPTAGYFGYDVGGGGWGNHEKQVYTRAADNARLSGDGNLIIEARRDNSGYTSARLVTRDRVTFTTGLLEARIKMPEGNGLHAAFWLLGSNIDTVGWPFCGEIDIIEMVDSGETYHNAIHGPLQADPSSQWQQSHDGDAGSNLADGFHTYQVYRDADLIEIGLDGKKVGEYTKASVAENERWVFDVPMYLILNVAVGGAWPRPVDSSTEFPAAMLVDWIRFWR
jgi:beta-glucanase (GH16 family)